jgi:hypothetical protein
MLHFTVGAGSVASRICSFARGFCFGSMEASFGTIFWPTGPGLAPHHDLTIRAAAVAPCNSTLTLTIGPSYTSADQSKLPERMGSVSWKWLENSSKTVSVPAMTAKVGCAPELKLELAAAEARCSCKVRIVRSLAVP